MFDYFQTRNSLKFPPPPPQKKVMKSVLEVITKTMIFASSNGRKNKKQNLCWVIWLLQINSVESLKNINTNFFISDNRKWKIMLWTSLVWLHVPCFEVHWMTVLWEMVCWCAILSCYSGLLVHLACTFRCNVRGALQADSSFHSPEAPPLGAWATCPPLLLWRHHSC
jgi:hypothetical protein